jgi:thiamine kinase-like enzyme
MINSTNNNLGQIIDPALKEVAQMFPIEGTLVAGELHGNGHINSSYKTTWQTASGVVSYIHQKINTNVFRNVEGLMRNISIVTEHLGAKLLHDPIDGLVAPIRVIPAKDGTTYAVDKAGQHWRTYNFIEKSRVFDVCERAEIAFEAAKLVGRFQRDVNDLDITRLVETIPNFLSSPYRLEQFKEALKNDPEERVGSVAEQVTFVLERQDLMELVQKLIQDGSIPLRVVHADTKINNALFHPNEDRALCLVDLDTCMPGYSLFDYGDLARCTSIPAKEDEQDFSRVQFNKDFFRAVTEGYATYAKDILNPHEVAIMHQVPALQALTLGVRFLTDHLNGDKYFKIHHPGHNLQRARTQFYIVSLMKQHEAEMQEIVRNSFLASGGFTRYPIEFD